MDSVFRNATNTDQRAELLADQRDGVVRGQLAPDAAVQRAATSPTSEYIDRIGGGHYIPGPGRQVMVTATIKR